MDAGSRIDGIPASDLWDLVTEVLHLPVRGDSSRSHEDVSNKTCEKTTIGRTKQTRLTLDIIVLEVDHVSPNAKQSRHPGLFSFHFGSKLRSDQEDYDSPKSNDELRLSHPRVALDRTNLDQTNLDPMIQGEYVNTQNQLADILTKGSFSRNEWNHLLQLFNILDVLASLAAFFFRELTRSS